MVTDFLLRVFQHHLVSSSHAVVIDHGKILVFYQQVITLVLARRDKGILLVDSIALIIAFIPKRIQSWGVIGGLQIGYGRVEHLSFGYGLFDLIPLPVILLHLAFLFQFLHYLIHILRNERGCPFYIQKCGLDKLGRFLQVVQPGFQISAALFFQCLAHAVTLCHQCAA